MKERECEKKERERERPFKEVEVTKRVHCPIRERKRKGLCGPIRKNEKTRKSVNVQRLFLENRLCT